jgi:hypothetical protein
MPPEAPRTAMNGLVMWERGRGEVRDAPALTMVIDVDGEEMGSCTTKQVN